MKKNTHTHTSSRLSRLAMVLLISAVLTACSAGKAPLGGTEAASDTATDAAASVQTTASGLSGSAETAAAVKAADLVAFDEDDEAAPWSESSSTMIMLTGDGAEMAGGGASVSGGSVTITAAGTYVLSGTLDDGQILVDAPDDADVRLVLNGVTLKDSDGAPIYIKAADNVMLTLEEGTENTVADGLAYAFAEGEDEPSAAIFSKADLVINGTGKLTVTASYNDGITSKDDLKIVEGVFDITAADDGIVGKDMVAVLDGIFTINAAGDGIKSSNDKDAAKGFVAIAGGEFDITAAGDGIQAETVLAVDGGDYTLVTGGGSANAEPKAREAGGFGGMGGGMGTPPGGFGQRGSGAEAGAGGTGTPPERSAGEAGTWAPEQSGEAMTPEQRGEAMTPEQRGEGMRPGAAGSSDPAAGAPDAAGAAGTGKGAEATDAAATEAESVSAKGLKAGVLLAVNGGQFSIDSADDALHSNGSVYVTDGGFDIATGDDGVHADGKLHISGGTLAITESYEGLEGTSITISGGDISIVASDDGVNAAGDLAGQPQTEGPDAGEPLELELIVTGGYLYVDAGGDGLDSNGDITMSGGTVIVNGPVNDGNGALDYDGSFAISGGTLIAAGSAGMAQSVSDSSDQYAIAMTYPQTQEAGTIVHLADGDGNAILTFAPAKAYRSIVISSPDLVQGGSYKLYSGGSSIGAVTDGLYDGGTYADGTEITSFELADTVTWLNESGVTEGGGGFGGGFGGMRGMPRGQGTEGTESVPGGQENQEIQAGNDA